jgi:hypothetical protein
MANTLTGFLDERLDADGNRIYTYDFPSNSLIGPRQPFTKPGQEEYLKQKAIADAKRIQLAKEREPAKFMDTPAGSFARGLVSDIYAGGKNLQEGFKTNINQAQDLTAKYITEPIIGFVSDEEGKSIIPGVTRSGIENIRKDLDTTVDVTETPLPDDSLYKRASNWAKDTFNYLGNVNASDALKNLANDSPDIVPGIITDQFNKDVDAGKLTDASQSDVTNVITKASEITNSKGQIIPASNSLTEAVGTDKKSEGYLDKLNSGIDTFLNDLDNPGFQVALAMHMEAKNGGDITSVLFEGMKVKKKAKKDALAAHANNLAVSKAELQILKLYQDLNKADEPSKNLINAATTLMEKQYELGDQSTGAAFAVSSMAMGIKKQNPNMSEYEALMQAVQLADKTKALEKDKWYTWGGKFDPSKLFTAAPPVVSTGVPNSKADMLKQLMAANTGVSEAEILQYINTTYPSLQ